MSIQARGDTGELETRVRIDITLADADISAEVAVLYRFAEELTVPEAVVTEFVERVSVMAAFPYVRESVSTTASRLGVAPPVLGMLRAGEFQVERTPEAPHDEPSR